MKKMLSILVMAAMILAILCPAALAATNQLVNGEFETGEVLPWMPRTGYPAVGISTAAYQGTHSARVEMTPAHHVYFCYQTIPVTAGETYYAELYAKLEAPQTAGMRNSLKIKLHGDATMPEYNDWTLGNIVGTSQDYTGVSLNAYSWTKVSGTITIEEGTGTFNTMLQLSIMAEDDTPVLFDAVRFEKIGPSDAVIEGRELIQIKETEAVTENYTVKVQNQLGETDGISQEVTWTLDRAYEGISVSTDGKLTVAAGTTPAIVQLIATSVQDTSVTAVKNIRVAGVTSDFIPPVIKLVGDETIFIKVGGTYTETGANVSDNTDGDISAFVEIDASEVVTSVAGTYFVTYNAADAAGNQAEEVKRKVVVYDSSVEVGKNIYGGFAVTTPNYSATITPDGFLSQLTIKGQEFSRKGLSYSEKTYDFDNLNYSFSDVKRVDSGTICASHNGLSIYYTFTENGMEWKFDNRTATRKFFNFNLGDKVNIIKDEQGNYQYINGQAFYGQKADFFNMGAKLSLQTSLIRISQQDGDDNISLRIDAPENVPITIAFGITAAAQEELDAIRAMQEISAEDLTLLSPCDYQVFQRRNKEEGRIKISGMFYKDCDRVEAALNGTSAFCGALPETWIEIPYEPKTRSFYYENTIPAGGWYRLTIRAIKDEEVVAQKIIDHVGVGEVFVISGQSNSTNSGETPTVTQTQMVSSYSGTNWKLANDPQEGVLDFSILGSPWPAFGDQMYREYGVPVGIASTGRGGMAVDEWRPPVSQCYVWMMDRVKKLGVGGFRALLWHQGEADAPLSATEYSARLKLIVDGSRKEAGWAFPWIAAQINSVSKIQALIDSGVILEGPNTSLLGPEYHITPTNAHLNAAGLKLHGEMWAEKVKIFLDKQLVTEELFVSASKTVYALKPVLNQTTLAAGETVSGEIVVMNKGEKSEKATLILSLYDSNGRLVECRTSQADVPANGVSTLKTDIKFTENADVYSLKAMAWMTDTLSPLSDVVCIEKGK